MSHPGTQNIWKQVYITVYIPYRVLVFSRAYTMQRESEYDSEVDPVVKLIWSKVCITIYGYLGSGIWDLGSGIWDLSSYT